MQYKKYGIENFNIEIIDIATTKEELNTKEIYWIKEYNATNREIGYNLTIGGDGLSNPDESIRQKMRDVKIGKKQSLEHIIARTKNSKGKKHNDEWNKKISIANKGTKPTEYTKQCSSKIHKDCVWYNDGEREYQIKKGEIIPDGLKKGRLKNPFPPQKGKKKNKESVEKMANSKRNQIWFNNGLIEKMYNPNTQKIPQGFIKGRIKHQ